MLESFVVREVIWQDAESALFEVREKVFICEQRVDPEMEMDGRDPECYHVLATTPDGTPVGTGRMTSTGKIGRVAVLMPYRGFGLGSQILDKLIEIAHREKLNPIKLNAQIQSVDFYQRHQFQKKGPVFMEAGIPHQSMIRDML